MIMLLIVNSELRSIVIAALSVIYMRLPLWGDTLADTLSK